jgi:hypothetical protein
MSTPPGPAPDGFYWAVATYRTCGWILRCMGCHTSGPMPHTLDECVLMQEERRAKHRQ